MSEAAETETHAEPQGADPAQEVAQAPAPAQMPKSPADYFELLAAAAEGVCADLDQGELDRARQRARGLADACRQNARVARQRDRSGDYWPPVFMAGRGRRR